MKAAARHAGIVIAGIVTGCALSFTSATSRASALPAGLPELPSLGETMQRDNRSGFALSGFDPVAYFLNEAAVPGLPDYELTYARAVWRFASAANRDAFREAPEVYTPRFGGFDASGVAEGRVVDADPRRFAVIGSRLYFFRSDENRQRFLTEAALRAKAQEPLVCRGDTDRPLSLPGSGGLQQRQVAAFSIASLASLSQLAATKGGLRKSRLALP